MDECWGQFDDVGEWQKKPPDVIPIDDTGEESPD